jgi:hypothetical protein
VFAYHIVQGKGSPVSALAQKTVQENQVLGLTRSVFIDGCDFETIQFHICRVLTQSYRKL